MLTINEIIIHKSPTPSRNFQLVNYRQPLISIACKHKETYNSLPQMKILLKSHEMQKLIPYNELKSHWMKNK